MRTLVVYYSRTGNTRMVAEEIAKILKADTDEIHDTADRSGAKGWLVAGRDASRKSLTEITSAKDPLKYDLVIIGTPIWAWTVTPAVRTYLSTNKPKKVAFFCTSDGSGTEGTFREMERLSKRPLTTLGIATKGWSGKVELTKYGQKIHDFCTSIKTLEAIKRAPGRK